MRAPKFLLDEHISPKVADQVTKKGYDATPVAQSKLEGQDDWVVLDAAEGEGRIVVTYNNRDFVPLLTNKAKEGTDIPGVIFVDHKTIPTSDIGGLARALVKLAKKIEAGEEDPSAGLFLEA